MRLATVDDVALEYESIGDGAPVVFIHGALLAETFRPLALHPRLAGYRCILYHRCGYGESERRATAPTITRQAADCAGLLGALGIDRAHVVGDSFGGAVALQLAFDRPEVVRSLVLMEPALIVGASGAQYRASLEEARRRYRDADTTEVLDEFFRARWPDYRERLDDALPGAFDQALADAAATFDLDLRGLLTWEFPEESLASITQPVLSVLGGESEQLWDRFGEVHRLLLARLPNARGYILPRASHFLHLQNLDDMADALGDFLDAS